MSFPEEEIPQSEAPQAEDGQPEVALPESLPDGVQPVEENLDYKDKYLRVLAEFDNMRKRGERERAAARKFALEALMRDLLPVLDALEFAGAAEGDAEAIREGIQLATTSALRVLQSHGLETIEAHGEKFDPRFHEAVAMRPHEELAPETVALEERKGYVLNERVLRPSLVHVVMAPPEAPQDSTDSKGES